MVLPPMTPTDRTSNSRHTMSEHEPASLISSRRQIGIRDVELLVGDFAENTNRQTGSGKGDAADLLEQSETATHTFILERPQRFHQRLKIPEDRRRCGGS